MPIRKIFANPVRYRIERCFGDTKKPKCDAKWMDPRNMMQNVKSLHFECKVHVYDGMEIKGSKCLKEEAETQSFYGPCCTI